MTYSELANPRATRDVLQRFALRAVIAEGKMIKNQCHIAPCS